MLLFILSVLVSLEETSAINYTEFVNVMILSSDYGLDPDILWLDNASSFNTVNNLTMQKFLLDNMVGYRNTMLNDWTTTAPDKVRVCFRDRNGDNITCNSYNGTGSEMNNWNTITRLLKCGNCHGCHGDPKSFKTYSTSFACFDDSSGITKYYSTSLDLGNGLIKFLVSQRSSAQLLPATKLNESETCRLSYGGSHPFLQKYHMVNQHSDVCSSICRELDHNFGAKYPLNCSCFDVTPEATALSYCNYTCQGNSEQMCGAEAADGVPSDAVIFNYVLTDIDPGQFDGPSEIAITSNMTHFLTIFFSDWRYMTGYDITIDYATYPLNLTVDLQYFDVACADIVDTTPNNSIVKVLSIGDASPVSIDFQYMVRAKCVYVNNAVTGMTYPPLTTFYLKLVSANAFITAPYISVSIAWAIEETTPTTQPEETCECDCWVYNLLYGESPYDNLTYEEIEVALFNVTEQIRRELTVNTSDLSATLRRKISADDDRASAIVVGYALGVAMLTVTFGGILLMDMSRVYSSFVSMKANVMSRFNKDPTNPKIDVETNQQPAIRTTQ